MRYLEESQVVTDFSPLSGPPPPVRSIWERWTVPRSRSPLTFPLLTQLLCMAPSQQAGSQFANSPHSYMIDNRKPLSGADVIFFQVLVPPPHVMKKTCPVCPCQKPPLRELAKYRQHLTCPTRDSNILDHCYTIIKNAYHSVPRAALGLSDHCLVHLIPTYRQNWNLLNLW